MIQGLYENVLTTYGRYPISFVSGNGCRMTDEAGKEYIDFMSGIGVCSVGHAHPQWVVAIADQASKLAHTSNLYFTEPGGLLAQRLCKYSGMSGVFFSNSGAESTEGLIKLARKYSKDKYGGGRSTILTLEDSFHGRTLAALTATGQDKFHQHFDPFVPGFRYIPANDMSAFENQGNDVCALLIEVVQGEGGVKPLDQDYVKQAAKLCAQHDWLLLIDEVQTGVGRLGSWFGFQEYGIEPDAVSFAKGIAGGLPLGGFMVNKKLHNVLGPGDHATTYGGNLVCCAAALATLDILEPVLPQVAEKGAYISKRIEAMDLPQVDGVRGKGLMIGVKIKNIPPGEINLKLLNAGLASLTAGTDVIRFLPPLVIEKDDMDAGLDIFEKVMKGL
ncbi:MAG: aspartate aminotransferase family protein [Defluviitaleaceae bacterium]|nr:aspartate aminotransferase family protein [Defluviitaleaceae bacterium]